MEIWLLYPYGSIPGEGLRPDRAYMIAEELSKAGHNVTWWVSNFNHSLKKFRSLDCNDIQVNAGFKIKLVDGVEYQKNISLGRICNERKFIKHIYKKLQEADVAKPDLIFISDPFIFRAFTTLKIVKISKSFLIIDILDLWPELFKITLPNFLKPFEQIIFSPLYLLRKYVYKKADGIIGVSKSYTELAKKIATRNKEILFETVYFGTDVSEFRTTEQSSSMKAINKNANECIAIYATTLGDNYDLHTLLNAAKKLKSNQVKIKILIAGTGPKKQFLLDYLKRHSLDNVQYIGNPSAQELTSIYRYCDIGLSIYLKDSTVEMPIKAFHYLSAGLAIVNSLNGEISKILQELEAGIQFDSENSLSLTEALEFLSLNPNYLQKLKSNSYSNALNFDSSVQYPKISMLIKSLTSRKQRKMIF